MFTNILVPLDGSPLSEGVFPLLRLLASRFTPPVKVHAIRCFQPVSSVYFFPDLEVPLTSYLSIDRLEEMVLNYLQKKRVELDGLQVQTTALVNDATNGILDESKTCDLILMASQGAGGLSHLLLGSVASKVAHGTTKPLLVVPGKAVDRPAKVERILIAVDGSPQAERAFAKGIALAQQMRSKVLLYQAAGKMEVLHRVIAESNQQQLEAAETYLKKLAATVEGVEGLETEVRGVSDGTAIVEVAEENDVDLLVMGSGGKSGVERWILGSQTERALRYAPCPVLIVP